MPASEHTQSPSDFRQKAGETLDLVGKTGEAKILTVNGEARAVLLSPVAYDAMARELLLARDAAAIQLSHQQIADGKVKDVDSAFSAIRTKLLARKPRRVRKHIPASL